MCFDRPRWIASLRFDVSSLLPLGHRCRRGQQCVVGNWTSSILALDDKEEVKNIDEILCFLKSTFIPNGGRQEEQG